MATRESALLHRAAEILGQLSIDDRFAAAQRQEFADCEVGIYAQIYNLDAQQARMNRFMLDLVQNTQELNDA